ncbi:Molybdopterin-guanine dinucleotide biosynthesis protein MobA [Thioalkalivibrio nitratireducens DSM 14787]|uniref:Molybdenum cofactor guanylyltransferase n=1 Tax=Thioalkalivibrio nitratireducens (strain DSM 14787 / UNIQEM 213 / ALEN2) TaxID=1255043 RepID=L0DZL2_THIND|nr:molybdenum cofactor guanylyltransferase MobA [Thioalkalivibrio nitratireducens]AGA34427.1 Molybdopterin-guanine dinucleotide biosynthesis protein MobA [Thioalkalivibrio nitratireducens DSM 14787]
MVEILNVTNEAGNGERSVGLILAGGQGRRMGGANKGWLVWHGRPLILHAIERLGPQVHRLAISSNTAVDQYRNLGFPVLRDRHADYRGPLAGIAAALARYPGYGLLCVPVDAPQLPRDLAERLAAALRDGGAEVAMAHDGTRLQPLFVLLRATPGGTLATDLARDLDAGPLAAGAWLCSRRHRVVDFSDQPEAFVNLNRPEDLERGTRTR